MRKQDSNPQTGLTWTYDTDCETCGGTGNVLSPADGEWVLCPVCTIQKGYLVPAAQAKDLRVLEAAVEINPEDAVIVSGEEYLRMKRAFEATERKRKDWRAPLDM